jgi:hypothetical protein
MAGPSWLANLLAAVMIATAAYCFSRLVAAWRWNRRTDYDVDGVHILMGVAMAGMLVPRLNPFWDSGWEVIFAAAVGWFGWQTIRGYRDELAVGGRWVAHHLQHVLACGAMLFMFLAVAPLKASGSGSGMAMGGAGGSTTTFPTLALLLTLVLVGYVIWTADGFTSLPAVAALRAAPVQADAAVASALVSSPAGLPVSEPVTDETEAGAVQAEAGAAGGPSALAHPPISPRLAACCEIAMGLTMGYMLITML